MRCSTEADRPRPALTRSALPQIQVTTPLLKLYGELVYNKAQRLTFDSSSPNGILLFRDASQIIVSYGTRVLEYALPPGADPARRSPPRRLTTRDV